MNITIRITGDTETIANLKKLDSGLTDFSSAMRTIGSELKTYYSGQVFASEGGVLGKRWANLSPVYRRNKGSKYPGKSILVASGKMQKSFRATTTKNSATIDNTRTVGNYNLLSLHQGGTGYRGGASFGLSNGGASRIGRGRNLPARPILIASKDVEDIVGHVIKIDVDAKVAKANS